ncbi:MAG TPA: Hpt domain-containing protein, partial [Bacteroidales bacterium]|nr:Hpt domain-containing protein [Bacteroidales bacterium]
MEDLFQKFKKQFIEEIFGLLEALESDLLQLEKDPENYQIIDAVFRAMHTIKGTSAMYGSQHISDYTHHLENIFQNIRDSKAPIDKDIADITFDSIDHIKNLMNDEKLADPQNVSRNEELLTKINQYLSSREAMQPASQSNVPEHDNNKAKTQSWYILLRTDEQIYNRGLSLFNIFSDLSELGTYNIHRITSLSSNEKEVWGIVLVSSASINDIREVFMFIEDYCSFVLIKDGDLQSNEDIERFAEMQILEAGNEEITQPDIS